MYKQLNIIWFVAASLLLHVVFFVQYQDRNVAVFFKNRPDSLDLVISKKIIQLHFSTHTKLEKILNNKTNLREGYKPENKSVETVGNSKDIKRLVDDKDDVKKQTKNNIVQPDRNIKQQKNKYNLYIGKILLEIEKNKFYPILARRRNMQEIISVSFNLLESGGVTNIETDGRYKILRHAARTAILNALPFTMPPSDMQFPYKVEYSMAFNLD